MLKEQTKTLKCDGETDRRTDDREVVRIEMFQSAFADDTERAMLKCAAAKHRSCFYS